MSDLSWIDHSANIRANAILLRVVADQSLLHADEIERLMKLVDTLYKEKNSEREMYTNAMDRYVVEIDRLRGELSKTKGLK